MMRKSSGDDEERSEEFELKLSVGVAFEEKIDKKIEDIEWMLWTYPLSLKDEKMCLQEIQDLRRHRLMVAHAKAIEGQ
eukprot:2351169-Heterocapsa_arctica.AAC.1